MGPCFNGTLEECGAFSYLFGVPGVLSLAKLAGRCDCVVPAALMNWRLLQLMLGGF